MKRNLSRYISIALLALFSCAFTIQTLAGITRNFKIELSTLFNGKYLKTIHTPADNNAVGDENPCEKETEDESETQFNPVAVITTFSQTLGFFLTGSDLVVKNTESIHQQDTQHPLYLVICTFKI